MSSAMNGESSRVVGLLSKNSIAPESGARAPRMEGEAGLREAPTAHRALGFPGTVGKFSSVQALRLAMLSQKRESEKVSPISHRPVKG